MAKLEKETVENIDGAIIKVIGVGGGGGNAVSNMVRHGVKHVEFINVNTDLKALNSSLAEVKVQIGKELTRGLGAGTDPERGRVAAEENVEELRSIIRGSDMVFIAAGMGGGTGTGASPVIAKVAKELNILTIAVVTKPFDFEGKFKQDIANKGIDELKEVVDSIIVIPNQKLFDVYRNLTLFDAFKKADDVLRQAVQSIVDLVEKPDDRSQIIINIDFADVKTIMSERGVALMGIGEASGSASDNRVRTATEMAISNPLIENADIRGAKGIIMNITASENFGLEELNEATSIIRENMNEEALFKYGFVLDESLKDKVKITIIATGFSPAAASGRVRRNIGNFENLHRKKLINDIRQKSDMPIDNELDIPAFIRKRKPRDENEG